MILVSKVSKSRTLIHIQDYEIDAMIGLGMVKQGAFAKLAISFERWCLKSVDHVSTISKE